MREWFGFALVAASAVLYAVVPTAARLWVHEEPPVLSAVLIQNVTSLILAGMLIVLFQVRLAIGLRSLILCIIAGAAYAAMLFSYVASVSFVSADTAVIVYFLYPVLVGVAGVLNGDRKPALTIVLATGLGFLGLLLAVGLSLHDLDPRGLLLALDAALCIAAVIIANMEAMTDTPSLAVAFYTMLSASCFALAAASLLGGVEISERTIGGIGLFGISLCSSAGAIAFIVGQGYVGATRASMISNLEPVAAVAISWAVLDEQLTLIQGFGALLVLAAMYIMEYRQQPSAP